MRRLGGAFLWVQVAILLVCLGSTGVARAQAPAKPNAAAPQQAVSSALSVERIYGEPSLSGHPTAGIAWAPDGKHLSYFKESPGATGKGDKKELWMMDVASGERRLLVSAEKLENVLPAETGNATQATGLGRHAAAQYQWAPNGGALLFQGPQSLAWLDLKTQTSRPLVSGKEGIADPKISPDGRFVSFVRSHNVWLVGVADGGERALTQGGTEESSQGRTRLGVPGGIGNDYSVLVGAGFVVDCLSGDGRAKGDAVSAGGIFFLHRRIG